MQAVKQVNVPADGPQGAAASDDVDFKGVDTRLLLRQLRRPTAEQVGGRTVMPESTIWRAYLELSRRGEQRARVEFVRGLRSLHRRRGLGAVDLASHDAFTDEHRGADDPFLGELWRAYKRCICSCRTGPAGQLLRDIEEQLGVELD